MLGSPGLASALFTILKPTTLNELYASGKPDALVETACNSPLESQMSLKTSVGLALFVGFALRTKFCWLTSTVTVLIPSESVKRDPLRLIVLILPSASSVDLCVDVKSIALPTTASLYTLYNSTSGYAVRSDPSAFRGIEPDTFFTE